MSTKEQGVRCYERARDDEEVFVLVADDAIADHVVDYWAYLAAGGKPFLIVMPPGSAHPKVIEAMACADRMRLQDNREHPVDGVEPNRWAADQFTWAEVPNWKRWYLVHKNTGGVCGAIEPFEDTEGWWQAYQSPERVQETKVGVFISLEQAKRRVEGLNHEALRQQLNDNLEEAQEMLEARRTAH